ncbi:MAG: MazG family protein [Lachnospiraceae bacterium]|nr:MazG family protein [Lachnospiraceae bacterium]
MKSIEEKYTFEELLDIIKTLCAEDGCPWDRVQTHESLIPCLRNEAEEVVEAIDHQDMENLCEELGDVLLQVVMHSEIARKNGTFTIADVIDGVSRKMVRRHPHVFGDVKADTPEASLELWRQVKAEERAEKAARRSAEKA